MNKFRSDLHFCHRNSLPYINAENALWRESKWKNDADFKNINFNSTEEFDEWKVVQWNSSIKANDNVYILGDVGIGNFDKIVGYLKRLNGKLHLIVGNHDKKYLNRPAFTKCFKSIDEQLFMSGTTKDGNCRLFLSHYPYLDWDKAFRGTVQLYGHIHNSFVENDVLYEAKLKIRGSRNEQAAVDSHNVGAMMPWINFQPRSLDEIEYEDFLA